MTRMNRAAQRARAGRLEQKRRDRDEIAPVESIPTNDLWAVVYRLQGRNRDGRFSARIREVTAEQSRRRTDAS